MPIPRNETPPLFLLDEKAIPKPLRKKYNALINKKEKALKAPKLKKVPGKKFKVPVPDKAYDEKHRKINKELHMLYEDISKTPR
jgi:hypothetical protein